VSVHLDARQRAMLEEMGVRVFAPEADPSAVMEAAVEVVAPPRSAAESAQPVVVRAPHVPVTRQDPASVGASSARDPAIAQMDWEPLRQAVAACEACKLCSGRTNTVFGVGDLQAELMVVGEAPGENEDLQGEPFVGQAGKLLDNMLRALGVSRRQGVYIANVLKCRPPGNRNPEPDEIAQCEPFLRRQVELLRPKIILAMGRFAVQTLLQSTEPIGRLRGRVHRYQDVPLVVTYHPAYLLRNLPDKAKAWADLCLAQSVLREPR
jgi:uracil-DNA glycosylase